MRTRSRSGIVAALLAMLVGCGGSAAPTVAGPDGTSPPVGSAAPGEATPGGAVTVPDDPCSLISVDDLKGEFDVDFPPAEVGRSGETRTDCIWDPKVLDASATVGPVVMTVMAVNEGQWDIGRDQAGTVLVPDVGDDAYFSPILQGALESRVGDVHLRFSVDSTGGSQADADASLVALAKLAISRL